MPMFSRPDSARTRRRNEQAAVDGLMREAQREMYIAPESSPSSSSSSRRRSSSSRRKQERKIAQEFRELDVIIDDGDGDDDDFDEIEQICLDEYEEQKRQAGSTSKGAGDDLATPPSPGSGFRQNVSQKRKDQDMSTRDSRLETRDEDINSLLARKDGPNLMEILHQRHLQYNKSRKAAKVVLHAASETKESVSPKALLHKHAHASSNHGGEHSPQPAKRHSKLVRRIKQPAPGSPEHPKTQLNVHQRSPQRRRNQPHHSEMQLHPRDQIPTEQELAGAVTTAPSRRHSKRRHSRSRSSSGSPAVNVFTAQPNRSRIHKPSASAQSAAKASSRSPQYRPRPLPDRVAKTKELVRTASWQLKQLEQKRIRQLAANAAREKEMEIEESEIWDASVDDL